VRAAYWRCSRRLPSRQRTAVFGLHSGLLSVVAGGCCCPAANSLLRGLAVHGRRIVSDRRPQQASSRLAETDRRRLLPRMLTLGLFYLALGLMLVTRWPVSGMKSRGDSGRPRMVRPAGQCSWAARRVAAPRPRRARISHPDNRLGLPAHPNSRSSRRDNAEEDGRRRIECCLGWTLS